MGDCWLLIGPQRLGSMLCKDWRPGFQFARFLGCEVEGVLKNDDPRLKSSTYLANRYFLGRFRGRFYSDVVSRVWTGRVRRLQPGWCTYLPHFGAFPSHLKLGGFCPMGLSFSFQEGWRKRAPPLNCETTIHSNMVPPVGGLVLKSFQSQRKVAFRGREWQQASTSEDKKGTSRKHHGKGKKLWWAGQTAAVRLHKLQDSPFFVFSLICYNPWTSSLCS